jgi:hypothetical protein
MKKSLLILFLIGSAFYFESFGQVSDAKLEVMQLSAEISKTQSCFSENKTKLVLNLVFKNIHSENVVFYKYSRLIGWVGIGKSVRNLRKEKYETEIHSFITGFKVLNIENFPNQSFEQIPPNGQYKVMSEPIFVDKNDKAFRKKSFMEIHVSTFPYFVENETALLEKLKPQGLLFQQHITSTVLEVDFPKLDVKFQDKYCH